VKRLVQPALFLLILAALITGLVLALRGTAPDRRNLDALVTVGGDVVRDLLHPAIDLTRISSAEEIRLGAEIDREVRASMTIGGSARDEAYVAKIAAAVTSGVTRTDIPYIIAVVRSPRINAFAIPGGRVYVTEGMLGFVQSEAELAAVIGHEISHVDLRHCIERLQLEKAAGKVSPAAGSLARLGYEVMLRGFSEEQELAADARGAVLAAGGSYDPWESLALFERFLKKDLGSERRPTRNPVAEAAAVVPEALQRYFATHPPADQRIEAVRRTLVERPGIWRGERRYVGRANLTARHALAEDARASEWVVRDVPL
jgi:predicted Zn-dependent protease